MFFIIFESKIYTVINIVAKNLGTIIYIILRKIFTAKASLILRNFSILIAKAFVWTLYH